MEQFYYEHVLIDGTYCCLLLWQHSLVLPPVSIRNKNTIGNADYLGYLENKKMFICGYTNAPAKL